jgi:hypothetical protein
VAKLEHTRDSGRSSYEQVELNSVLDLELDKVAKPDLKD